MFKSIYIVKEMDCPSEVQLIRMQLEPFGTIESLQFDIPNRQLDVYHIGDITDADHALMGLDLGVTLQSTTEIDEPISVEDPERQRKALVAVLIINLTFFAIEMITGLLARSMGLVGDSLDMLADSFVYMLSLLAVGRAYSHKQRIARATGWLQLLLATVGLVEVVRRFIGMEAMPIFEVMILVSVLALIANTASLMIINRVKSKEAHMTASVICTSNDIIVNLGVIAAGILVHFTASRYPDLIIGGILFLVVARGAWRILKLAGEFPKQS